MCCIVESVNPWCVSSMSFEITGRGVWRWEFGEWRWVQCTMQDRRKLFLPIRTRFCRHMFGNACTVWQWHTRLGRSLRWRQSKCERWVQCTMQNRKTVRVSRWLQRSLMRNRAALSGSLVRKEAASKHYCTPSSTRMRLSALLFLNLRLNDKDSSSVIYLVLGCHFLC